MEKVKRFFAHWGNGAFGAIANTVGLPGYPADARALVTETSAWLVLGGTALMVAHLTAVLFNNGDPYRAWSRWIQEHYGRGVLVRFVIVERGVKVTRREARMRIGSDNVLEFPDVPYDSDGVTLIVSLPSRYRLEFRDDCDAKWGINEKHGECTYLATGVPQPLMPRPISYIVGLHEWNPT